ncbi:MAG: hypothetical protein LRY39_00605 [Alphaproteobacteria bacterium]|nr:hypothetical protein [Alphaproteobacteria bacterium]
MLQTMPQNAAHALPRQAEQGDARMALQRRQEEQGRRNPRQQSRRNELRNDEASVSIEALQMFLETLLRSHEAKQEHDNAASAQDGSSVSQPAVRRPNYASPSAQAARAYASASSRTGARRAPAMESAVVLQNKPLAQQGRTRLTPAEREQVSTIKENLAALTARGIEYLSIQRGESFLGSLAQSAELALHQTDSL